MRIALTAGIVLFSVAGAASATPLANGQRLNGHELNGHELNGVQLNGVQLNGHELNGVQLNGTQLNGMQLQGTLLTATLVDSPMCAHSETAVGAPLPASCNACAKIVCNGNPKSDPHCCSTTWDATCVAEAQSWCSLTANDLLARNGTLTMNLINQDNSTAPPTTMRIKSVTVPETEVYICSPGKNGKITCRWLITRDTDINLYNVEYQTASGWQPICPYNDADGDYNIAIPIVGAWETREGYFHSQDYCNFGNHVGPCTNWGGGGKVPGTDGTAFAFTCRDVGATAKCLERLGYRPWKNATAHDLSNNPVTVSLDETFQACVRMLRADYCGDGHAHTRDGTLIDVSDGTSIQYQSVSPPGVPPFGGFEAEWGPGAATCISSTRFNGQDPDPTNQQASYTTMHYIQDHCPQAMNQFIGSITTCGESSDFDYRQFASRFGFHGGFKPLANVMNWSSTLPAQ
jgi:hypothetical protein